MNYILFFLLAGAFGLIHCLIGGTQLIYSIPSYGLLASAGVLALATIRRVRATPDFRCLVATAVLTGYVLLRVVFSRWTFLGGDDFYMVLGCLLVYLLAAFFLTESRWRVAFVAVLLALALADVVVGLIQFRAGKPFMLFGFVREESHRASGMFICPDHLAGYLEVVGVMAVSIVCWARLKVAFRMLIGYAALCCYVGIAISGSRGGYVSTFVSLVAFALLSAVASRRAGGARVILIAGSAVLVIAVIAAITFPFISQSNLLQSRFANVVTDNVRHHTWMAALDQFRLGPVTGTGAGSSLVYHRLFRREEVQADPVHAHNDYLELLAEYGIIGMAGMIFFLGAHIAHGLRTTKWLAQNRLRHSPDGRSTAFALQAGALAGIAALLVHSIVDFNMHIPGNALLLAFLFAIVASPNLEKNEEPSRAESLVSWFRFALPVLGLAFLAYGGFQSIRYLRAGLSLSTGNVWTPAMILPRMPGEYWTEQARVALHHQEFTKSLGLARTAIAFDQIAIVNRKINPENPMIYFYEGEANRGLALRMQTSRVRGLEKVHFKRAVESYARGLDIFPEDENLLVRIGQCYDGLGGYEEAEKVFQRAFKADPNLGITHAYYGAHLLLQGRFEESREEYKNANRVSDHNVSRVGLSELWESQLKMQGK